MMNKDMLAGKWHEIKGDLQQKWGELTDDELDQIAGDREKLLGTIQKKYGITKEEAEQQLNDWERDIAA